LVKKKERWHLREEGREKVRGEGEEGDCGLWMDLFKSKYSKSRERF
jgi:hypothetical protein